jgi:dTMP kinase
MFITIEGMDGVGKTSVAKKLALRLDAIYMATPPNDLDQVRSIFTNSSDRLAQYHFFISSVLIASERIDSLLETESVICDRYYYTTLTAYKESIESMYPDLWENIHRFTKHFVEPDHAFLLTADTATRQKRMALRSQLTRDDVESLDSEIAEKQIEAYERFGMTSIETSDCSIKEVVSNIMDHIGAQR